MEYKNTRLPSGRYDGGERRGDGGERRGGYRRLPGSGGGGGKKVGKASRMIQLVLPEVPTKLQELQELTLKLGDYTSMGEENPVENAQAMAEVVVMRGDLRMYGSEYADFLIKCFQQLTIQIPLLTTMVSLLASSEVEFVEILRQKLEAAILVAVFGDEVSTLKLLLKAMACLASSQCLAVDSMVALLSSFLVVAEAALANNNLDECSLVCFYLLFNTVLWCPDILASHKDGNSLLLRIGVASTQFKALYRSPFRVHGPQSVVVRHVPPDEDEPIAVRISVTPASNDPIHGSGADNLWELATVVEESLALMHSSGNAFAFPDCMLTPWRSLVQSEQVALMNLSGPFVEQLMEALHHKSLGARSRKSTCTDLASSVQGDAAAVGRTTGWLRSRFPIFSADTNEDVATCCALPTIVRSTALTYFQDVLQHFDPVVHRNGGKYGSVELLGNHLLATQLLFPADSKLEYLLVESLFQLLLQPPINTAQHTMVSSVLLHLCKTNPVYPPIIGLATNILFQFVPDLDVGVTRAFGDWFSFHFLNTMYVWHAWQFWVDTCALTAAGTTPEDTVVDADIILTRLFCHHTVQKLSRVVSFDRLKTVIPGALQMFFDYDEVPRCSHFSADARAPDASPTITAYAFELKKMMEERMDAEEILDWMENLPQLGAAGNEELLASMFTQALCLVGAHAETQTAFLALLDAYGKVLRELGEGERQHTVLAKSVFDACSHHAGMTVFLFRQLLQRGVVSSAALAGLLKDSALQALTTEPLVFELFQVTVEHVLSVFREAVLQCRRLGVSVVLDETADLTPSQEPVLVTVAKPAPVGNMDTEDVAVVQVRVRTQEEEDAQVDFDEDEEVGRKVRRRVEDDGAQTAPDSESRREMSLEEVSSPSRLHRETTAEDVDKIVDPQWIATEACKVAVGDGRAVYRALVGGLLAAFQADVVVTDQVIASRAVAKAMLVHLWRHYAGLETHLEQSLAQRVIATDISVQHEVVSVLTAAGEAEVVASWSRFLSH